MSFLQNYTLNLTALSPVHIGSGQKLTQMEYVSQDNAFYVMNMPRLLAFIASKDLTSNFEKFCLGTQKQVPTPGRHGKNFGKPKPPPVPGLADFFRNYSIPPSQYANFAAYSLANPENLRPQPIARFVRDAYGKPYIPGSSLKGALRTAVIAAILQKKRKVFSSYENKNLEEELADEIEDITLNRPIFSKEKTAINNTFRAFRISDSLPLDNSDLILAQKIDVKPASLNAEPNKINTLRESLRPGTVAEFSLSIDRQLLASLTEMEPDSFLKAALNTFAKIQKEAFFSKFKRVAPEYDGTVVILGGGTDYQSKTLAYPLYGKKAVSKISRLMHEHFPRHNHKMDDLKYGVSPHTLKCTYYDNKLYQMGICAVKITSAQ